MTKDIYVQARADHVASLASASPLAAVEELVWNALDADAREVRVDLITNALGGIDAIRVTDDGTGIDILRADETFGSLGGSWKRSDGATTTVACTAATGAVASRRSRWEATSNGAQQCAPAATSSPTRFPAIRLNRECST